MVGVGGVALVVTALVAGGAGDRADERGICVDRTTDTRLADEECEDRTGSSGGWYYIPAGRDAPAEGEKISGQGSYSPPSSSAIKGGVASDGGEVTRGGFFSGKSSFGG